MRVARRVVHHLVPRVAERPDGLRIFVHPVADDKKRGMYAVLVEYVDKLPGVLVAPRRIERQRDDLVIPLDGVDRKLARRR